MFRKCKMLFYSFPPYVCFFFNSIILNYLKQKLLEIIPARLYCKYFLHGPRKMQDRLLGSGSWRRHRRHSQTPSVDRAGQARQGQWVMVPQGCRTRTRSEASWPSKLCLLHPKRKSTLSFQTDELDLKRIFFFPGNNYAIQIIWEQSAESLKSLLGFNARIKIEYKRRGQRVF